MRVSSGTPGVVSGVHRAAGAIRELLRVLREGMNAEMAHANLMTLRTPEEYLAAAEAELAAVEAALARPPAGEDAVGELLLMLEGASHLSVEAQSLIAAAVAERAGEREVKLDVVGTSELVFGAGKWSAYRLVGPHALCIRAALGLVDADTGTSLSLAIRRLDPPKPRAKRPWRLSSGMLMCPACEIKQAALSAACRNDECRQYAQTWGDPRDLPSGEEVGE